MSIEHARHLQDVFFAVELAVSFLQRPRCHQLVKDVQVIKVAFEKLQAQVAVSDQRPKIQAHGARLVSRHRCV